MCRLRRNDLLTPASSSGLFLLDSAVMGWFIGWPASRTMRCPHTSVAGTRIRSKPQVQAEGRRPRHPPNHQCRRQQQPQHEPRPSHQRPRSPSTSTARQFPRPTDASQPHRHPHPRNRTSPPTRPAPYDANAAPHATPGTSTPATAPESNPTPPPPAKKRKLYR